jgi:hypothetical protein
MGKLEILLQSPEAEALAAELEAELSAQASVTTRKLPTRGVDATVIISIVTGAISTADILIKWYAQARARGTSVKATAKSNAGSVDLEAADPDTLQKLAE